MAVAGATSLRCMVEGRERSSARAATLPTPVGPLTAVVDADGALLACGWSDGPAALLALVAAPLRPVRVVARRDLGAVTRALTAYVGGEVQAIDVAVRRASGPFVHRAWEVLRAVAPGAPVTYTELAALAGRPGAGRAAGAACARNAAALVVPCHRALRADGAPGGFRWGLGVKRWLLQHEARAAGAILSEVRLPRPGFR
jgi:methylated-DNA-[protein]-cysteine S-methyltransferase